MLRAIVAVAPWMAFVSLLPSGIALALVYREAQIRGRDNAASIRRNCDTQDKANKLTRERIRRGPANSAPLLRLLGFTEQQITDFVDAAEISAAIEAEKVPDPNCDKLPSEGG
jgi:hypothetical protein